MLRVRMSARSTDEAHRASSALELLFDLTFVVAVAAITVHLAAGIADGDALSGLPSFLEVFFAIWWAWMNFTWFASSYDTDDVPYRMLTLLQMAGVLLLAAGVPVAIDDGDFRAVTLGYLVMRVGLVVQWLRASIEDPAHRSTTRRYALGISLAQVGWLLRQALAEADVVSDGTLSAVFVGLVVVELAVPLWAERASGTTWHPHHIAERYGLFVIILLGESVLAASSGVDAALDAASLNAPLVVIALSGLGLLFALWWLYFLEPSGDALARHRDRSFLWGYGHYGIFAALAALGAGLEVAVEHTGHHLDASATTIGYSVAIPVVVFLVLLGAVQRSIMTRPVVSPVATGLAAGAILVIPATTEAVGLATVVAAVAAVCTGLVVVGALASDRRASW